MSDGAWGDPLQLRRANGIPSSFTPARERSVTPRRGGPLTVLRGGSSPPERERALDLLRTRSQRPTRSNEQFWMQCTENAMRMQEQSFEEVAASYMLETKQAFQTERAAWRRTLLAEEQRMAAHGRHEAQVERHFVEHQMMDSFKQHALQQSVQFQQAAQTEQQSLAGAEKVEIEASRQELILAQSRFHEASSQQHTHINLLKNVLTHAEARDGAVREDLLALRSQSESYSHLLERAEHSWQLMPAETRTADQLVRTQRSELTTALQELTANK